MRTGPSSASDSPSGGRPVPGPDDPLRIAYLTYRGKPHVGGQGVYTRHLSKALVDMGHHVEVLSGQPYPIVDERVPLVELPSLDIYNDHFPMRMPGIWELKDRWDWAEVTAFSSGTFPEPLAFSLRAWDHLRKRPGQFDLVQDNQCLGYGLLLMERMGADFVIAEGCEAGGHIGELTTMALVPQVVDAVKIPVIAAGGIADSRQLVAAFALGAQGVQVGTCLLVSEECPIHENYKNAVLNAKDTDTTVTGRIAGVPVRIIKNKMAREYIKREKEGADKMELEKYTLGSLRRAVFDGDVETGSLMAGQVAGMCNSIRPVSEIIRDMFEKSAPVLERLSAQFGRA